MSTNAIAPTTPAASLEVVDSLPPSTIESITRGEIDIQIATAKKFPRSMAQFKRDAFEMVSMDEETAASCIYRRPVGKDPETGQQKFAEGLSIRMAEIVSACYGNIRYGAFLVEQTERMVKARGFCHDVQKNVAATSEAVEATVKKNGQPYDERMRTVVAKAALSKAARDAVFKVVPRALCRPIEEEAKRVAIGDAKTLSSRRDAALKWCASLGVQADRVCAALGLKGVDDIGLEQLETLTGLKTSIKDGDVSVEEAFPFAKPEIKTPMFEKKQKPTTPAKEPEPVYQSAPTASTPLETLIEFVTVENTANWQNFVDAVVNCQFVKGSKADLWTDWVDLSDALVAHCLLDANREKLKAQLQLEKERADS